MKPINLKFITMFGRPASTIVGTIISIYVLTKYDNIQVRFESDGFAVDIKLQKNIENWKKKMLRHTSSLQ